MLMDKLGEIKLRYNHFDCYADTVYSPILAIYSEFLQI